MTQLGRGARCSRSGVGFHLHVGWQFGCWGEGQNIYSNHDVGWQLCSRGGRRKCTQILVAAPRIPVTVFSNYVSPFLEDRNNAENIQLLQSSLLAEMWMWSISLYIKGSTSSSSFATEGESAKPISHCHPKQDTAHVAVWAACQPGPICSRLSEKAYSSHSCLAQERMAVNM